MDEENTDSISQDLDNDSKMVLVGSGVRIEGRIDGAESTDVSGSLSGTLKSSRISINTSGSFNGDMNGQDVVISGNVEGEITSEDTIIVNQSAKIKGTIEYSSLQVSYGAKLEGSLRHRGSIQNYSTVTSVSDEKIEDAESNIDEKTDNEENNTDGEDIQ
jgi:cytoskeletal protein CcmA (bactofilin family)|tara:strand:+ start:1744 stop:2223 length:480 start_codon:yes stop_codon:yes gene_type:complete